MRCRKGFTLVELLIVISIISMLVGTLLPSLGRAREITRRTVCRKNLHSMGQALITYATEHNAFPDIYHDRGGAYMVGAAVTNPNFSLKGNSCNMFVLVRQDLLGSKAFICPSSGHAKNIAENLSTDDDFRSFENLSYSLHMQRPEQGGNKQHRPVRLTSDASMAMAADRTPVTGRTSWRLQAQSGGSEAIPQTDTDEGGADEAQSNSFNHEQEGQNVVHRDGHAAWSTTPSAGVEGDNIWTWDDGTETGSTSVFRDACAAHKRDSFLFP